MLLAIAAAGPAVGQTPAPDAKQKTPPTAAPAVPAPDPFAFPEDDSKTKEMGEEPAPAAPTPNTPAVPDAGGYSSSSDTAPGSSPADSAPDAPGRKKLELHDVGSTGHIDTLRAEKDVSVADFYIKDGNYTGAYLRYKDAVVFDPENADAHFGLATMARKTGKTAEALTEYNAVLKLDPQSRHAKESRKAIAELQPTAH
jgi:tetratricopeptide (TPR) repeat protein